jgi:hypothetical protein
VGGMWSLKGFIAIGGYKKRYLVKKGVSFIGNMYWEGGSTNIFWEVFINI